MNVHDHLRAGPGPDVGAESSLAAAGVASEEAPPPDEEKTGGNPVIDNDQLLEKRTRLRLESIAPRVGDYVIFPDGREERISHDWGEPGVQTSVSGSFYLGDGYASFSGALNPSIPTERLVDTGETKPGSFWFFSGDYARADNGVDVEAPCRVYRYAGETEGGP